MRRSSRTTASTPDDGIGSFGGMPGIDSSFLALPYRALGEAALARAADLGASHADFRFERIRIAADTDP